MVGRLVEQQQVGRAHQRLRQVEAHAPAAREARHRLLHLFVREAQAVQQLLGARAHGVGVRVAERGVELAHEHAVVGSLGGRQLCLEPAQRRVAVDRVVERRPVERGRLLRDVGDAPARGIVDLALVGCSSPRSSANRLDLPVPLAPIRPILSPGFRTTSARFEQDLGAADERELGEANHGRG